METLKKYKSLLLCFVSLLFMAGMCEKDPDVGVDVVPVKGITLDCAEKSLEIGETFTIAAEVTPENATNSSLNWKSNNDAVATVKAGKVSAVAVGQAIITATAKDGSGVNASCVIKVLDSKVLVESVTLDREEAELNVGETLSLKAIVAPNNADCKDLKWSSHKENIASVDQEGTVKALAEGMAIITATATDGSGKSASCLVLIQTEDPEAPNDPENPEDPNDPENPEDPNNPESVLVEQISLSRSKVDLQVGENFILTAKVLPEDADNQHLQWSSDETSAAIVENGVVTAVGAGAALVKATATDGSGKFAYCMVTVMAKPEPNPDQPENPNNPDNPGNTDPTPDPDVVLVTKITLNKEAETLNVGGELSLVASVYPKEATEKILIWTSSNESVATVYEGRVVAKAPGQAVIKAMARDGSGVSASCVVTVSNGGLLSPVAAKNKMETAGITFVNAIKANAHQNLVNLMDYTSVAFEDFEFDEAYFEKLEDLVEESGYEDYARGVNPVRAMMGMTGLCLNMAKSGAQLSTRAADVYTLTVKAGLKDLYGKFTPDYANEVWKWNSSVKDRLEVAFTDGDGQQWVATLKGSSATTRLKITVRDKYKSGYQYTGGPYDDNYSWSNSGEERLDYTIDIPKEITFVVKCGGTAVVDLTINSNLAFEMNLNMESEYTNYYYWDYWYDYYEGSYWYNYSDSECAYTFDVSYSNLNMDAKMKVNGYEETFKTDITKSGITASAGIKIDGRSMLSASAGINADMDALIADAQDEDFKARNIKNFSMKFDALGEVQIDAECSNFKNLYDAIQYLIEAEGIEQTNSWLDEVNAAYTAKLRFDNTSTTQATFELEAMEENDGWDSYIYTYPVMVFSSNNSRYSLDEYFTETSFSDLIDTVERLAEQFEDLYSDYFEREEDYYPEYGGR